MRICKRHLFLCILFTLWGCTPSFLYLADPLIYVKKDLPGNGNAAKIIVFPFESPSDYPGLGMYTATLFYQRLLKQEEFREVAYVQVPDWYEKGKSLTGKTELAAELGRDFQSEYVLIGSIDYYLVGHITSNRVTVTARLMETATGETLYYATEYGSGKPGKTFFPYDVEAGETTPATSSVLSAVVDKLVKGYFGCNYLGFIDG
jgi:TolB-like protein